MNKSGTWVNSPSSSDVRRASMTALLVGVILVAIDPSAALPAGELTPGRILQICLTFIAPYVVSTTSSVAALRVWR